MGDTPSKDDKQIEKKEEDEQEQGRSYLGRALRVFRRTPPDDDKKIVMRDGRAVRRRRGSYDLVPPNMRNDNNIGPNTLVLIFMVVGALIGAVVGAQAGVSGSCMGIICGAVVGFLLAKLINH